MWRDATWIVRLFTTLTFSHLLELARIDDEVRRAFYEIHCLKERWSVREFQRQKDSMLYERIGLSENRDAVLALAREEGVVSDSPAGQLRDPYVFEFLGIERRVATSESDLESALVEHLQLSVRAADRRAAQALASRRAWSTQDGLRSAAASWEWSGRLIGRRSLG